LGKRKNDSTDRPLVSVITVVFNNVNLLEKTIRSVINQTYSNIEYIVIDGGSTDGTVELIKKYDDFIDYWVSENDSGIYDAMNKGVRTSSGSIIGIINSDDCYDENAIQNVVDQFVLDQETGITYGEEYFYFYIFGKIYIRKDPCKNIVEKDILISNYIGHPTVFIKKSIYLTVGLYDASLKICADWDFFVRAYKNKYKFTFIPKIISHCLEGGVSSITYRQCKKEIMLLKKRYGTYSLSDLCVYFVSSVKEIIHRTKFGIFVRNMSKLQKLKSGQYNIIESDSKNIQKDMLIDAR